MNPSRLLMSVALPLLMLAGAWSTAARANVSNTVTLPAPIVRVNVQQGDVAITTWNRQAVQVDGDPSLVITRRIAHPRGEDRTIFIPPAQAQTQRGAVQLAPESFVVSSIPAGPREIVVVRSSSPADVGTVSVRVPADSVFVFAHAAHGDLDVRNYKGGTLLAFVGHGRMALEDMGGTVFAETRRAPLVVRNSNFDRIRARSLTGNITFERCSVRQIQATSIAGSIVYDGGSFEPGLARFESTSGNVAVGTAGAAVLGARTTGGGRVFTDFPTGTRIEGHGDSATASVGAGGPIVTATSGSGNVYLYGGSLRAHSSLPPAWQPATQTLQDPSERTPPALPFAQRRQRNIVLPARVQALPPAAQASRPSAQPRNRDASVRARAAGPPSVARPAISGAGPGNHSASQMPRVRHFRG